MKLFVDGEWDDGRLLSLALVAEDGRWWYEVVSDHAENPWVREHVVPFLGKPEITRQGAQDSLVRFLFQFPEVHIIADWPEDIAQFCNFLISGPGHRIDTPPLTMEILRWLNSDKSEVPHNALADALAMSQMYLEANRG
jgi:hypothetical protein